MNNSSVINKYRKAQLQKKIKLFVFFILLLLSALICTSVGVTNSNISDVVKTVFKLFQKNTILTTPEKVILHLRLPRILMGFLAGFGLSFSGVIMQGITRNPLVSPFTIGVSSSASFGASIAILFGFSMFGSKQAGIICSAFLFSFTCTVIIFSISKIMSVSSIAIILSGIAINYLFQALSAAVQFISDDNTLARIVHWTFGSLNGAEWIDVAITALIVLPAFFILYLKHTAFSMISVNDDETLATMGVDAKKMRVLGSFLSSLSTAAVISFTGVIGFIGLAAPHIARRIIGNDYRYLLPCSIMTGAFLIIISDTLGRILFPPIIIPVGIIISFLGVPIFLQQIITKKG